MSLSWVKIEFRPDGKIKISFKRWHPLFWWEVYRELRSQGNGVLTSLWYTAVMVRYC